VISGVSTSSINTMVSASASRVLIAGVARLVLPRHAGHRDHAGAVRPQ
jgi:hypothetical protein